MCFNLGVCSALYRYIATQCDGNQSHQKVKHCKSTSDFGFSNAATFSILIIQQKNLSSSEKFPLPDTDISL